MKKYTKFTFVAILTVILLIANNSLSYAKKNNDYINEVINISNGKIEECGIKESVILDKSLNITEEKKEDICLQLLKKYEGDKESDFTITIQKDDFRYCINFESNNASGYIESNNSNNNYEFNIKVLKKTEKYELESMKTEVYNMLKKVLADNNVNYDSNNVKYVNYVKAKISEKNISSTNDLIIGYLKKQKVKNIDTVNISNGISTVAYTKNYEPMNDGGSLIDFNYMINQYSQDCYLVIGTPVIDVDFEQ